MTRTGIDTLRVTCAGCHGPVTVGGYVDDIDPRVYRCLTCRPVKQLAPSEMALGRETARSYLERWAA